MYPVIWSAALFMIMVTHPLPSSCFFACKVEKCAVDCYCTMLCVNMGKPVSVYPLILAVIVVDVVIVWAILSMYYKFLWYHGSESVVRVC